MKFNLKDLKSKFSGKDVVLSFQHMFAMLGSTILVPMLCDLSVPLTLMCAGIGTLIFYFVTKRKVPVFLGSSFALLPCLIAIMTWPTETGAAPDLTIGSADYNQRAAVVMICVMIVGIISMIFSLLVKLIGPEKIKKLLPPVVTGPIIMLIGLTMITKMFYNNLFGQYVGVDGGPDAWKVWTSAGITLVTIVAINAFAKPKSFLKIIPVLIGFIVGYIYSLIISIPGIPGTPLIDFADFTNGTLFGADKIIIFQQADKIWGYFGPEGLGNIDVDMLVSGILMAAPMALVTFMEHIGDISANSTICNKDFMTDPGLHRTVLGDALSTTVSGLLGGPDITTYGENSAVLAITKNFSTRNIALAAVFAIIMGVFTPIGNLFETIPQPVVGGASIILFGMIAGNGLRSLVDAKVDMSNTKNLLIVSITLGVGLGISGLSLIGDVTGNAAFKIMIGDVEISALAIATILAIILNLIIPSTKEEIEPVLDDINPVSLSQASGIEGLDVVKEEKEEIENKETKNKRFYWFSFKKKEDKKEDSESNKID